MQSAYFDTDTTIGPKGVFSAIYFQYVQTCFFIQIIEINNKQKMEGNLALRSFIMYVKRISNLANQLEHLKRRLAEAVRQIEDYIECFREMDLDKCGKITQKVMQNYLISKRYFHEPTAISRFYSKYSHQKGYLIYEDMLEALMPSSDYILISHTLTNPSEYQNRQKKFTHSCERQRIESIRHLTAFIISQELKALDQDYVMMREITRGSQRIGAILWRLLDKDHNNTLNYQKLKVSAEELGIQISENVWNSFLYWQFHSYKTVISRQDFMRVLNIHEQRKRATSACKIDQYKVQKQIFKRAEQQRARNERIRQAVGQKLAMMPLISTAQYLNIMREEHLPYELLNSKRELKGKKGYSNPKNLVKYVVQRH